MMFVGGVDLKWFVLGVAALAAGVVVVVMIPGVIQYAQSRLEYWLDPFADPQGLGFQTIQSLLAIGSGGVMGLGLGNSRQKYLYIPEPQNDFVFSIVCEELGLVGASIIVILFALLVWRGYVIAIRAQDKFGAMLSVGLTTQVGLQALLNIAVVTNTHPKHRYQFAVFLIWWYRADDAVSADGGYFICFQACGAGKTIGRMILYAGFVCLRRNRGAY